MQMVRYTLPAAWLAPADHQMSGVLPGRRTSKSSLCSNLADQQEVIMRPSSDKTSPDQLVDRAMINANSWSANRSAAKIVPFAGCSAAPPDRLDGLLPVASFGN